MSQDFQTQLNHFHVLRCSNTVIIQMCWDVQTQLSFKSLMIFKHNQTFSSSLASRLSNVCDWLLMITFYRKLCVNKSVLMSQKARITIRQTCGTKAGDENVDEPLFSYYIYWRHAFLQVISKFISAKQKIYIKVSWGFCHFISIFSQQIIMVWVTPEFSFSDGHS